MNYKNPTIYVIINKSLNMNPGKVAAQTAHAEAGMMSKLHLEKNAVNGGWIGVNPRTVIVLEAPDQAYMERFSTYLNDLSINLLHYIYTDESSDFYKTAMAVEPVDKFDPRIGLIFGAFKFYTYDEPQIAELHRPCHYGMSPLPYSAESIHRFAEEAKQGLEEIMQNEKNRKRKGKRFK